MATPKPMTDLPSSSEQLAALLNEHGYETNPQGLARKDYSDYEISSDSELAFVDINADSVRTNGKVPKRPIRLLFYLAAGDDGSVSWKLESVRELTTGEESKCLNRYLGTPEENAPWPP